jgi:hypothetical protein
LLTGRKKFRLACPKQTSEVKTRTLKNEGCGTRYLALYSRSRARIALLFPRIAVFVVTVALPKS